MDSVGGSRATDKARGVEYNVHNCDLCLYKGSVKTASTYCGQCQEYMCVSCTSTHNSLKLLRDHVCTTVTGSDLPLSEERGEKKPALSYCSKHGDKETEWFCEKHEAMFCDACRRIEHRKCQVMSISDMKSSAHGQSLEDVINSLIALKCRIAKLKSGQEMSAEDLMNVKQSCKDAVQQFKSSVIKKLERLEKELMDDIDKAITTETVAIQDHIQTCDSLIPHLEAKLAMAGGAKTATYDVASVIAAYELSKTLKMIEPTVTDLEQDVYNINITFQPSSKLTDMLGGVDRLGIVEIDRTQKVAVDPPMSASRSTRPVSGCKPLSDMDVVSSTEINIRAKNVTSSAVMPDGKIILVDWKNSQIILLDHNFNMQSTLTLAVGPWDVAVYGDNAAVVTLPWIRELQYIHVGTTLQAGHTIPTGQKCWGVAVHGGKMYVIVSDGNVHQVLVLDAREKVMRRIGLLLSSFTSLITVSRGGTIYTTSYGSSHITCYTNDGDVVYSVEHDGMRGPQGMVVDEEDNLLVCCQRSSNIHVLGKDGTHRRVILSSADGLARPQSVAYRRSDQTLIVTMQYNASGKAYKLK